MRQVFLQKGAAVVKQVSQPRLDEDSVLVCVHYSFISSGTELATIQNAHAHTGVLSNIPSKVQKVFETISTHGVDGTAALIREKLQGSLQALGYSVSGQVIAVGSKVRRFRTGDYVACAGAGYANHADLVCVPEHMTVKINDKEHVRAASLIANGATALQAIRRAQLMLGERVCVIGLGLLGQLTVQLVRESGCSVIGVGAVPERRELAAKFGAQVFDSSSATLIQDIQLVTEHQGVDAVIITMSAAKNTDILNQALAMTRHNGRIVVLGDVGLTLNREDFYTKEIDLRPVAHGFESSALQMFIAMIEQSRIQVEPLISAEIDLDAIDHAYEKLENKKVLGLVLRYGPNEEAARQALHSSKAVLDYQEKIRFSPAVADSIRVGVVGAGGFAKVQLMPLVSKLKNTKISAIVDANMAHAINSSKLYGAAQALAHDDELFSTDIVDAVVISSSHKFHCDQALKALAHGKAVFLEKPMVTDFEQLGRMQEFFRKHPNMPFCVDYNRSFAPFMIKIKNQLLKRSTPLVIHYRMNAGHDEKQSGAHMGAGRIIGEACHILDLFCFLTDANPVAVSVESLHAQRTDIFPTDNFTVQISFDDGSICSLLYTALGHASLGKERMELFFDGKSIVMEEYTQLYGFGISSSFNETVSTPDKGHEGLLRSFFKGLHKKTDQSPIPFSRLYKVAELSLIIDQLACEGGGNKVITP